MGIAIVVASTALAAPALAGDDAGAIEDAGVDAAGDRSPPEWERTVHPLYGMPAQPRSCMCDLPAVPPPPAAVAAGLVAIAAGLARRRRRQGPKG